MNLEHLLAKTALTCAFATTLLSIATGRAAELRSTANDQPVRRTVKVEGNAAKSSPTSEVSLASYIEHSDHRVLVNPPAPSERIARNSTIKSPSPTVRPEPIIQDDGVWVDEPVWHEGTAHSCNGSACGGCGYGCYNNACCNTWFNAEMLVWWRRDREPPPLVTTGPSTNPDTAGELGQSGTTILAGGQRIDSDAVLGGRVEFGYWMDPMKCTGLAIRFWQLGNDHLNFFADSNQFGVLARPFLNVSDNLIPEQDTQLVAFPNQTTGSINISSDSDALGGDVYLRRLIGHNCGTRIEYLLGYQMSRIDEDLQITSHTTVLAGQPLPEGTTLDVRDTFDARNEFHGASIGLMTHSRCGCWTLNSMTKFGIGNSRQMVIIDGQTVVNSTNVDPNGLLARETNEGRFSRDRFVVIPELNLTAGYALSNCLEVTMGYSLLVWTSSLQVADQLDPDLAVNLSNPPTGQQRPEFRFDERAYVLQGMTFGVRCRY